MSEPAPVPADQEEALRDRYTVVYEGDPDGMKILSGEQAPGRAVTVIVGDQWEEVATLRAERDQLASELREEREALKRLKSVALSLSAYYALLPTRPETTLKTIVEEARRALSDPRPSPEKGDDHA
jgi:hypothetical protein